MIDNGFDDMSFLSFQVLLEEAGKDVITTSPTNGICKGMDTSVPTISYDEVLSNPIEYYGIVILAGPKPLINSPIANYIQNHYEKKRSIVAVGEGILVLKEIIQDLNLSNNNETVRDGEVFSILNTDKIEDFVEEYIKHLE